MTDSTSLARIEPPPEITVTHATLKYLGYDPDNIATHALVALAKRYRLDPLLGEIQLISDSKGRRVYITRDGMLEIAHRSGRLDGIVVDEERRSTADDGWTAYVSVYVKGMSHPFRYGAQCKDKEPQAQRGNGPEMALTRAERRALKRAFRIRSDYYPEHPEHGEDDSEPDPAVEPKEEPSTPQSGSISASFSPVPSSDIAPTSSSTTPSGETPLPIDVTETEFIVPTQEQTAEMKAAVQARGFRGRPGPRHEEFTRILGREITDDNDLSRADYERVLAEWRTDGGPF